LANKRERERELCLGSLAPCPFKSYGKY